MPQKAIPLDEGALDVGKVGATSEPYRSSYDWRDQALYALGIGARSTELAYLYEGHPGGMKVYPTYAVIPAFVPIVALMAEVGIQMSKVIHGAQAVRVHRVLPPEGTLETVATLSHIYDLKRFAQAILETTTSIDGELAVETQWTIIVRDAGRFGGQRPPPTKSPAIPKDREPDFVVSERTTEEQALLYRLNGDVNPLHADPGQAAAAGFERGPILHGLATYGFVARACVHSCAGGEADRLRFLRAQFKKPVWPGETIVTEGWKLDDGRIALQAQVLERSEVVVSGAWAEID